MAFLLELVHPGATYLKLASLVVHAYRFREFNMVLRGSPDRATFRSRRLTWAWDFSKLREGY